jgi:hypothetical protein
VSGAFQTFNRLPPGKDEKCLVLSRHLTVCRYPSTPGQIEPMGTDYNKSFSHYRRSRGRLEATP